MQFFAGFLGTFFSSIFAFFAAYLGKKTAMAAALIAIIFTITTAFYLAMKALIFGFVHTFVSAESHWFIVGFYSVLPSNAVTCMSIIFTAEVLAYLYRYKVLVIQSVSQSN